MRWLVLTCLIACGAGASNVAGYRLTVRDRYEVGEDPTILVAIDSTSDDDAVLIITRPDNTTVRQKVPLSVARTNVRFGNPVDPGEPTFTAKGDYRVELKTGNKILAKQEIRISVDRLTQIFPAEDVAGFELAQSWSRARQNKNEHWMTYGALYEHKLKTGTQINVTIEEPGSSLHDAWKPYEEEGTLGVIEDNNVRFRERSGSVSASWISGKKIIGMRAATLEDFERGFIGHFLARFPSNLQAR